MKKITITPIQARQFLLNYQGLSKPDIFKGKSGIVDFANRVGCIQFDPLNIVGHNHELVLQSRIDHFHPSMLDDLLYQDRVLIDGWDKNMSIFPTRDWPFFQRNRVLFQNHILKRSPQILPILPEVRQIISDKGPLTSADLHFDQKVDWAWAPTKLSRAVLEYMYFSGELIIHHKTRTRKAYDFACKYLPEKLTTSSDPNATDEQYHDWHILRRIGSVGLLWNKPSDAWLGISGIKSKERNASFSRLLENGLIVTVEVTGIRDNLFIRTEDLPYLEESLDETPPSPQTAILAPLDNLIWDRRLIKALFDFEYRWEVYIPVELREYGYYVLPILSDDRFVARFEPGFDKKNHILYIKNWWWEKDIDQTKLLKNGIRNCFNRFCHFLGASQIRLDQKYSTTANLDWLS
jgi:uncharacterized protein YcaQ